MDAYTLYYVGQALYQAGGPAWDDHYTTLRDYLVLSQVLAPGDDATHGSWRDNGANGGGKIGASPAICLELPSAVSSWRCRTDICRSCKWARPRVSLFAVI